MAATYELWDFETGNMVGAYGTESAALAAVRESAQLYGSTSIESLLLGREDHSGHSKMVAKGPDLLAYATMGGSAGQSQSKTIEAVRRAAESIKRLGRSAG